MRDLQHLEELSAATAFGSWANDVVVALDTVHGGGELAPFASGVLEQAALFLRTLADPTQWRSRPRSARSVAATETTRTAVTSVLGRASGGDHHEALLELATAADQAAHGQLPPDKSDTLDALMRLFDRLGDLQLARSNAVLTSRKDAIAWTGTTPISVS